MISHGIVTGLRVVLFLGDVLAGPCLFYFGEERQEIKGTLAEVFAVANVVVMVVKDKGDIKFMADGEEVMDGPVLLWESVGEFLQQQRIIVGERVRLATSSFSKTSRDLMSSESSVV